MIYYSIFPFSQACSLEKKVFLVKFKIKNAKNMYQCFFCNTEKKKPSVFVVAGDKVSP